MEHLRLGSVAGGLIGSAVAGLFCALACAPESGSASNVFPSDKSGSGGSGASGGDGGGLGAGTGAGTGEPWGGINVDGGTQEGDGALSADSACSQFFLKPESVTETQQIPIEITCTADSPSPIALYLVLDNSGSMDDSNKWNDAVTAITAFVQNGGATGKPWTCVDKDGNSVTPPADLPAPGTGTISVAIQYFHPQNAVSSDECDGIAHASPAVGMAPIPANAGPITTSLGQTGPNGNTPTVGALTGGVSYCGTYQQSNPEKCVVVLITDGQPNGCGLSSRCPDGTSDCVDPNSAATLTPIAGNAYSNASNSVTTFTVGMNGVTTEGFDLLNAIAIAGGSDCTPTVAGNEACNVTTGGAQGFLDALNAIRQTVQVSQQSSQTITTTVEHTTEVPCQWSVPDAPSGQEFDKNLVNVTVTTGPDGGRAVLEPGNVASDADCAAAGDGWYYDDNAAPKHIIACPNTCKTITNESNPSVQVLFGCATKPAIVQ